MRWKSRGTVRREAAGIKRIQEYLEYAVTFGATEIEGILHTDKDCSAIHKSSYLRGFTFWEDQDRPESISCKIGRGAWIEVKTKQKCPHCSSNKKIEDENDRKMDKT